MPTAMPPCASAGAGPLPLGDGPDAGEPEDAADTAALGALPSAPQITQAEQEARQRLAKAAEAYAAILDRCLQARRAVRNARANSLSVLEAETGGRWTCAYRVLSIGFESLRDIIDPVEWSDDELEPILDQELLDALRREVDPAEAAAVAAAGALSFALAQLRRADGARAEAKAALDRAVTALAAVRSPGAGR